MIYCGVDVPFEVGVDTGGCHKLIFSPLLHYLETIGDRDKVADGLESLFELEVHS